MTTDVGLVEIIDSDAGLVVLRWFGSTRSPRDAIWSKGKMRKSAKCAVTGRPLASGDDAYRPVGNQDYRGRRIHPDLVGQLVAIARDPTMPAPSPPID